MLGHFGEFVDLARGDFGQTLGVERADHAAAVEGTAKHFEFAAGKNVADIDDLLRPTRVRLVAAESVHCLAIGHARERRLDLHSPGLAEHSDEHLLDQGEDVLRGDETHLDVRLGEFRLAVGPKVLVAETARDLEIFLHSRGHEQLLVLLRGLRQRVERPRVQPARHEEVARALRSAFAQDRRLDLPEPVGVEHIANSLNYAVTQTQIFRHARTAQVEVAVSQTQVFVGDLFVQRKRQHVGLVEDLQLVGHDLDRTGGQLVVFRSLEAFGHFAGDLDHVLIAQSVSGLGHRGLLFRTEDNLRDALAVAQIDKNDPTVVATRADPTREGDAAANIFVPEGRAMMCPENHGAGVCKLPAQSASDSCGKSFSVRALRSFTFMDGHSAPTTRANGAPEASASLNWRPTLSAPNG